MNIFITKGDFMCDITNEKSKKFNLIDNPVSKIIFCIVGVLLEDIFIAFFPVIIIFIVCLIPSNSYPTVSIYNNLFVGFCTINAGNILYLSSKKKLKNDNEFYNTLIVITFFSFTFSLICCCCYSNADMGYIKIAPNMESNKLMISIFE